MGRFCSNCGNAVAADKIKDYTSYHLLLADDRCKQIIASEAAKAQSGVSAGEFLSLVEKIVPIPLELMGNIGSKVIARLGIKTGKAQKAISPHAFAYVLLGALCSLARNSLGIQSVMEAANACTIEAKIPSGIWSWEGKIRVAVLSQQGNTEIYAETEIPGQMYDWGKSKRTINKLLTDIQELCEQFSGKGL